MAAVVFACVLTQGVTLSVSNGGWVHTQIFIDGVLRHTGHGE
jgi:hypothetical protein